MDTTTTKPQVDLPGQTHVAQGPHDQTGMYLMHHAFRRDLDRFVRAVRGTPVGDAETWTALRARWDRFADVLHHHHQIEDTAIWPVLLEHARAGADRDAERLLLDMEAEHDGIDPALIACHQGFAAMADHPCDDHRNALDVRVTAARELLAGHLRHEETEALPYLQQVMTAEEFEASEKAAGRGYPPSSLPFIVPWVLHEVPGDTGRDFVARAGKVYALLHALTRRRFLRGERRAFRYA
jgi:hemerythrin-like domain-containing protein